MGYARSQQALKFTKVLIGLWCWLYGLTALLALLTPGLAQSSVATSALVFTVVTTLPVGVGWILGGWPNWIASIAFVIYADVVLATVLIAIDNKVAMLPAAALFTVIGSYIAGFHGPRLFVFHQLFSLTTASVLYIHAFIAEPDQRLLISVYLVVLVLVIFSAPMILQTYMMLLRRDATSAYFDPLTGLFNRRGFDSAMTTLLDTAQPGSTMTALLIDIDNFKAVNDQYGHEHGDAVIRATAGRIATAFPAPAVTVRLGGEEFGVVLIGDPQSTTARADMLTGRLHDVTDRCPTTASVGVAHADIGGTDINFVDELLDRADKAMFAAKRHGGNQVYEATRI